MQRQKSPRLDTTTRVSRFKHGWTPRFNSLRANRARGFPATRLLVDFLDGLAPSDAHEVQHSYGARTVEHLVQNQVRRIWRVGHLVSKWKQWSGREDLNLRPPSPEPVVGSVFQNTKTIGRARRLKPCQRRVDILSGQNHLDEKSARRGNEMWSRVHRYTSAHGATSTHLPAGHSE